MSPLSHHLFVRRGRVASVLLAGCLTLCACGSSETADESHPPAANDSAGEVTFDTDPTSSPAPTSSAAPVDDAQADDRIPETVTAMFTWRIHDDDSPADAIDRTRRYLDPRWIRETESRWSGLTKVTSSEWDEWNQRGAVDTRVSLKESSDERPEDSPSATYRGYAVTQRVVTQDGQTVATRRFDVFTVSSLDDNTWKITDLTLLD